VLGAVLAFPLIMLWSAWIHLRAMMFDRPDSPFQPNEIEGGVVVLVTLAVLVTPALILPQFIFAS
jgi:hypothetical protein